MLREREPLLNLCSRSIEFLMVVWQEEQEAGWSHLQTHTRTRKNEKELGQVYNAPSKNKPLKGSITIPKAPPVGD